MVAAGWRAEEAGDARRAAESLPTSPEGVGVKGKEGEGEAAAAEPPRCPAVSGLPTSGEAGTREAEAEEEEAAVLTTTTAVSAALACLPDSDISPTAAATPPPCPAFSPSLATPSFPATVNFPFALVSASLRSERATTTWARAASES